LTRSHVHSKDIRWVDDKHDETDHMGFSTNDYEYVDSLKRCRRANWAEKGMVTKVKDQKTCGSCWAHNTVGVSETLHALTKLPEEPLLELSEQQLVNCNMIPNLGCWGGQSMFAFDYVKSFGLTTAENTPYKNKSFTCHYNEETDKAFQLDDFKVYERINTHDLETLLCHGAVAVPIWINDCFKNYQGGILTNEECNCNRPRGVVNHAVTVVGFGKQYEKGATCARYYLIKNSWGAKWGEEGFIRVCAEDEETDFGTCNLRRQAIVGIKAKKERPEEVEE
jgi:C1A family cysteine protease